MMSMPKSSESGRMVRVGYGCWRWRRRVCAYEGYRKAGYGDDDSGGLVVRLRGRRFRWLGHVRRWCGEGGGR